MAPSQSPPDNPIRKVKRAMKPLFEAGTSAKTVSEDLRGSYRSNELPAISLETLPPSQRAYATGGLSENQYRFGVRLYAPLRGPATKAEAEAQEWLDALTSEVLRVLRMHPDLGGTAARSEVEPGGGGLTLARDEGSQYAATTLVVMAEMELAEDE